MSINRFYSKWGNLFYGVFFSPGWTLGAGDRRLPHIAGAVATEALLSGPFQHKRLTVTEHRPAFLGFWVMMETEYLQN